LFHGEAFRQGAAHPARTGQDKPLLHERTMITVGVVI